MNPSNNIRTLALALATLLSSACAFSQPLQWLAAPDSKEFNVIIDMVTNGSGEVYIAGHFDRQLTLKTITGNQTLTASSSKHEVFIAKYDAEGKCLWAQTIRGRGHFGVPRLALDAEENLCVSGAFVTEFGISSGLVALHKRQKSRPVICTYAPDGERLETKRIALCGGGFEVDEEGAFYVSFPLFRPQDVDPSKNEVLLSPDAYQTGAVAKYSREGDFLWAQKMSSNVFSRVFDIKQDEEGNVYACGTFEGTLTLPGMEPITSEEFTDVYIIKFSPEGRIIWLRQSGDWHNDHPTSMAVGSGRVYLAGESVGRNGYIAGPTKLPEAIGCTVSRYIEAWDTDGSPRWKKVLGSTGIHAGMVVATDSTGLLYAAGSFGASIDLDPSAAEDILLAHGYAEVGPHEIGKGDFFTAVYDADGNLMQSRHITGKGHGRMKAIIATGTDGYYIAGIRSGSFDFGPVDRSKSKEGGDENGMFIARYDQHKSEKEAIVEAASPVEEEPLEKVDEHHKTEPSAQAIDQLATLAKLYPNPAQDVVRLELTHSLPNVQVTLRAFNGAFIRSYQMNNATWLDINLSDLASGVYFLQLSTDEEETMLKLIRESQH